MSLKSMISMTLTFIPFMRLSIGLKLSKFISDLSIEV